MAEVGSLVCFTSTNAPLLIQDSGHFKTSATFHVELRIADIRCISHITLETASEWSCQVHVDDMIFYISHRDKTAALPKAGS